MVRLSLVVLIAVILTTGSYGQNNAEDSYKAILAKFIDWKELQFSSGKFARPENCYMGLYEDVNYNGPDMGLPDDCTIIYTDINGDDKSDALITFFPSQCDGGNASMNWQMRMLVLSDEGGYSIDDAFVERLEETAGEGWFIMTGAEGMYLYGTYYEYRKDDGRCCPSIAKDFFINYRTGKISYYEKDNQD